MTNDPHERLNAHLNSLPLEDLQAQSAKEAERAETDFQVFRTALSEGRCSLCGMPVTHFSERKPCLHWLLKPRGFKKKHFPLLYPIAGFHRMNGYLRWVANSVTPIRNINDLTEDRSTTKVIEETIRYKNREWSFRAPLVIAQDTKTVRWGESRTFTFR